MKLDSWVDKVNGYGVLFRFLTPALGILMSVIGTMVLTTLSDIKKSNEQVRLDLIVFQNEVRAYNTNHLEHHNQNEVNMAERLACIETELKRIRK